jgi:hypothetical protein
VNRQAEKAIAAAMLLSLGVTGVLADQSPRFADYPTTIQRNLPPGRLNLSDPRAYSYRTRLREASRRPVNFAGHYQLAEWGCGTDCATGAIIDALTGQVWFLPSVDGYGMDSDVPDFQHLQFRADSSLLIISGSIDDKGPKGWHFYSFERGNLTGVHFTPWVPAQVVAAPDNKNSEQIPQNTAAAEVQIRALPAPLCHEDILADKSGRLVGDKCGREGSGCSFQSAGGTNGVTYQDTDAASDMAEGFSVGDPLAICLISEPINCPPGDNRGKIYLWTNRRTGASILIPDSEHMCGGA